MFVSVVLVDICHSKHTPTNRIKDSHVVVRPNLLSTGFL